MGSSIVLLPTFCERLTLPQILPRLSALDDELDVLVIDDASPDGTGEIAEELSRQYPRLSVLHRREKEGLGPAYVHGFREAIRRGYSRIVTMDADLSHAPEDVPRLLAALEEADLAIGSRHLPGGGVEEWPLSRQLLSRAGSLYARALLRLPVSDVTSGFRAYRADALAELDLSCVRARGFVFQVEVLRRILDLPGARAVEVPIVFRNRAAGASKLSRRIITEAMREVLALAVRRRQLAKRQYRPLEELRALEPQVTVVVPARPELGEPEALKGVSALAYPREKLEVIVARGCSPSQQRNAAVREGSGAYLLFLDDDSLVTPELLRVYLAALGRDPTLGAVGGPAEALPGSRFQALAALVLGEPWVVGRTASRYRACGNPRFTDERELILCDLCVRRRAFEEAGGFNESLYPNEEKEFMERLRCMGWRLQYRPEALVRRPQIGNLAEFLAAIQRYGRGRSAQLKCLPTKTSLGRLVLVLFALLLLIGCVSTVLVGILPLGVPIALYAGYLAALALRFVPRAGILGGSLAALLVPFLHGAYAAGLLRGLFRSGPPRGAAEVSLERPEVKKEAAGNRSIA